MENQNKCVLELDIHTEEKIELSEGYEKYDVTNKILHTLGELEKQGYFKKDTDVDMEIRGINPNLSIRFSTTFRDEKISMPSVVIA